MSTSSDHRASSGRTLRQLVAIALARVAPELKVDDDLRNRHGGTERRRGDGDRRRRVRCGGKTEGGSGDRLDFDRIYGDLAIHAGYTFPDIDAMFLEDYEVLCRYWIEHPPLQLMVQAYLGIKPKRPSPRPPAP